MEYLTQKLNTLPKKPGVYMMKDDEQQIIYIGKAKNLKNRVSQYFFNTQKLPKVQAMVDKIKDIDYYVVSSENDAFALESTLIKKHQPFYNILLKDNKAYQYIKIDLKKDYPRFELTRRLTKGSRYFGPFFGGVKASELLDIISYTYPLIKCGLNITKNSKHIRPCIYHSMGLCSAPCAGKISPAEYRIIVDGAIKFLKGDTAKVGESLQAKMEIASASTNYETALKLRDAIKMLSKLNTKIITQLPSIVNYDIFDTYTGGEMTALCVMIVRGGKLIGIQTYSVRDYSISREEFFSSFLCSYYSQHAYTCDSIILPLEIIDDDIISLIRTKYNITPHIEYSQIGIKRRLLDICVENAKLHIEKNIDTETKKTNRTIGALHQLKRELHLSRTPHRIECYDISNTHGTNTVSSMSVIIDGEKYPSHYRKFKVNTVSFIDDFASMRETLSRRFAELDSNDESFGNTPDLILIDGGKGQLSAVMGIAEELNYTGDIVSLAKRQEEVFTKYSKTSIIFERDSYALRILQLARDEAHRIAITYNRALRNKTTYKGGLIGISGIGGASRRKLLSHFRTIERIKNASIEELLLCGINKTQSERVYQHFHTD